MFLVRLGEYNIEETSQFTKIYKTADAGWQINPIDPNIVMVTHQNDVTKNKYGATRISGYTLVDKVMYEIVSRATLDFTTIGAPNNNVGTQFFATGGTLGIGDSVKDMPALIPMTTGYWSKHLLMIVPSGVVYSITPSAQYTTEELAKLGPIPLTPEEITSDSINIALIISTTTDILIENRIYDIRPMLSRIFGYGTAGASSSVISHNTLTKLGYVDSGHLGFQQALTAEIHGGLIAASTEKNLMVALDKIPLANSENSNLLSYINFSDLSGSIKKLSYISLNNIVLLSGTSVNNVSDMQNAFDNTIYTLVEVSGTPAFRMQINFTGITSFIGIIARYWYMGNSSHTNDLRLLNRVSGLYDSYRITKGDSELGFNFVRLPLLRPASEYILNGDVQAEMFHASSGITSHRLYIDLFGLEI